jgi:hypothetical protein
MRKEQKKIVARTVALLLAQCSLISPREENKNVLNIYYNTKITTIL